jgi:hypothetical protein
MLRSGGAVIHMKPDLNKLRDIKYIVGDCARIEKMPYVKALNPFSDRVITFLNDLSHILLKTGKDYSDVATFGFWCRKAALLQEKNKYDDLFLRLGRGVAFHITPSNVPVNFAFSLATGLIAGNVNIVRIPSKNFPQVEVICKAINELLADNADMATYIAVIQYSVNKEITDALSMISDMRIIWGGDSSIDDIRRSPLKPRANEITFADRHSIALINADEYLKADKKDRIARDFYNDTYFSDQNACTSPRILFWLGDRKEEAKAEFWKHLHVLAKTEYELSPIQAVGKLNALYLAAADITVRQEKTEDEIIKRVSVPYPNEELLKYTFNSGFFFETDISDFKDILPVCNERCQTIIYYGINIDELKNCIMNNKPHGVDRVVPMGKSMDFSLIWDGYDLVRAMSRRIGF